jgi:Domain of unknown function (DUF2382)
VQLAHRLDDDEDSATVPLVEERAIVRKRKRLTGGVRVRTVVHEDEQVIDETLRAEQVEVKRVPLDDRWVAAPVPVRQEGDTTIVAERGHGRTHTAHDRRRANPDVHRRGAIRGRLSYTAISTTLTDVTDFGGRMRVRRSAQLNKYGPGYREHIRAQPLPPIGAAQADRHTRQWRTRQ